MLSNHVKYRQHIKLRYKFDSKNSNPPKRNQRVRKGLGITQFTKSDNVRETLGRKMARELPKRNRTPAQFIAQETASTRT